MKKIKGIGLILRCAAIALLCAAMAFALASCQNQSISISVEYSAGESAVYESDSVESLRDRLTVKVLDMLGAWTEVTDYSITGELSAGQSVLTVTYGALSEQFELEVAAVAPESIRASFSQSGDVFLGASLDSLREDLTVTVINNDASEALVENYALSGELSAGESVITVEYGGLSASFTVSVTGVVPVSLEASYSGGEVSIHSALDYLRDYLEVWVTYNDTSRALVEDYALSGELSLGDSVVTVAHSGFEANVTVTAVDSFDISGMRLEYSEEKGGYEVVEYTGADTEIAVPNSCGGIAVVGVGDAFAASGITSIILPTSLIEIEARAFLGCTSLQTIEIPAAAAIGERAFYGCVALLAVEVPSDTREICDYAFYGCTALASLRVADGGALLTVGKSAFSGCAALETVDFGENSSLRTIEHAAFYCCKKIESLALPSSLSEIGSSAFERCVMLRELIVADNGALSAIGACAFDGCERLSVIDFGENSILADIGACAFAGCSSLVSFEIPASLETLGEAAFENCISLSSYTVAAGNAVFSAAGGVLYSIDGATLICYPAAADATEFRVPDGVVAIGSYAFACSQNLETVLIAESVRTVGARAFYYCAALSEITIPKGITDLGNSAFMGSGALESVVFEEGSKISVLKAYMFVECLSLKTVSLPSSLGAIGPYAFGNCISLEAITIPASVTVLADGVFFGCEALVTARFEVTAGWGVATSQDGADWVRISVLDERQNARWLRGDYSTRYWLRA